MHKPYTFYKRNGTYYVRFRGAQGERTSALSTGCRRRSEAESFAIAYLRDGKLDAKRTDSFGNYTRNFFSFENSTFIQNEIRCGRSYGKRHADENDRILRLYLLPVWKDQALSKISVTQIEGLLLSLHEKGYSSSRIIATRNVLAAIFKEAFRTGVIDENPMERVSKITSQASEKGIYSDSIVSELFSKDALTRVWAGNEFHYLLNYLAYCTGLRQGELLALMPENVKPDRILVKYSWERGYGLKEPKYKSNRVVPLTQDAHSLLSEFIRKRGVADDQLIFAGENPQVAIDHRSITRRLYEALERVGLDAEARAAKNLTFHSWRHLFTSKLRGKISEAQLKLLTGHKTAAMVDHYSHYDFEAVRGVKDLQEEIFGLAAS